MSVLFFVQSEFLKMKTPFVRNSIVMYFFCVIGLSLTFYLATNPLFLNLDPTFVTTLRYISVFSIAAHIFHFFYALKFAKSDVVLWSIQGLLCGMFSTRLMEEKE
jgi:hypothetical protein